MSKMSDLKHTYQSMVIVNREKEKKKPHWALSEISIR